MTRVAVLGAGGMLGAMLARVLERSPGLEAVGVTRRPSAHAPGFDALTDSPAELLDAIDPDWVLNAIGRLRSRIDEGDPESVADAFATNGEFPHRLLAALGTGRRMIHFGTDAVFAGRSGPYDEAAPQEPADTYARSKARGESLAPPALVLRCSLVGPEAGPPRSLLGWALAQPRGAVIEGHANRRWNGLTTWHLARLCEAIVSGRCAPPPSPLHLVPRDQVSKARLLELTLEAFGRDDVTVEPIDAEPALDPTLATRWPDAVGALWRAAGYERAPTIASMLSELATADSDPAGGSRS